MTSFMKNSITTLPEILSYIYTVYILIFLTSLIVFVRSVGKRRVL